MERHYYHCASKGLDADILFSSRAQLVAGMNRVGLCGLSTSQSVIIAFVLMDNHVHFILHGTCEECKRFVELYQRLTEVYLRNHASSECGKDWNWGCWMIPNREMLSEKICYVLRNPLAAGMATHPSCYMWGSGPLMFAGNDLGGKTDSGIYGGLYGTFSVIGEMSVYRQRKLFNTKISIPKDWLINQEGLIWPGSYVSYKKAEAVFSNIYDYMYSLNIKNEDKINLEMYGAEISLHDKDLLQIVSELAEDKFGETNVNMLTLKERMDLCRIIRRTHGANIKQLSRLLHIRVSDMQKLV